MLLNVYLILLVHVMILGENTDNTSGICTNSSSSSDGKYT